MESPGPAAPCETILNSLAKKLGSDLGPIAAESRVIGPKATQKQLKRDNNLAFLPLLRDQGSEVQILSPRPFFSFCSRKDQVGRLSYVGRSLPSLSCSSKATDSRCRRCMFRYSLA